MASRCPAIEGRTTKREYTFGRSVVSQRRRVRVIVAILSLARASSAAGQSWSEVRAAIERGAFDRAESLLDAAGDAEDALFFRAVIDEQRLAYARALEGYRAFVRRAPSSPYAARALARIEDLERRDPSSFELLASLERARRAVSTRTLTEPMLRELERAARGAGGGATRDEALLFVGDSLLDRAGLPRDAARLFAEIAADPRCSSASRQHATQRLLHARTRTGDELEAARELRALAAPAPLQSAARALARRRVLAWGAALWLVALAMIAVAALVVARARGALGVVLRRWAQPAQWLQLAALAGGGAVFGHYTDGHDLSPFAWLGAGAAAVLLAARAWSVVGSRTRGARVFRAMFCAGAVCAVSFLAMYVRDPMMLEGIGL